MYTDKKTRSKEAKLSKLSAELQRLLNQEE